MRFSVNPNPDFIIEYALSWLSVLLLVMTVGIPQCEIHSPIVQLLGIPTRHCVCVRLAFPRLWKRPKIVLWKGFHCAVSMHHHSLDTKLKVTIRPGFSGTVPIFNDVSRKNNHSPPWTPICPVFGLVSWICSDLPISAAVCLRIGGYKLAQILSVYTQKSLAYGASPRIPLEELTTLHQIPKSDPWLLAPLALAPYDSTIRPRFCGTVLIFNDVSQKKVLPGRPFVPFLAWCPGFVPIGPSLQPYAYASVAKN